MARSKKVAICMHVGDFNPQFLEYCKDRESAEKRIASYERDDRYQVEVEHYGFAHGMPVYEIR